MNKPSFSLYSWDDCHATKSLEQAGAELGQAQLKLGLGFTSINLHYIDNQTMALARLTVTNLYGPKHM